MVKTVIQGLASLTLIANIGILVFGGLFMLKFIPSVKKVYKLLADFGGRHAYVLAFIISLVALLGSLFFSEVAKFDPCVLCWYQRIMMYPQPFLLYMAIARSERVITPYLLLLNVIGALIAGYHYALQRFPVLSFIPCSTDTTVSCVRGTFYFGFISIPFMSLSAFVIIIILLLLSSKKAKIQSGNK